MRFLRRFDFNHITGYCGVILVSIAISSLLFSLAHMFEGIGWLSADDAESNDLYLDVGWNWIRGSGVAFIVALVLFGSSILLLRKNLHLPRRRSSLFGKLDINQSKGLLGLVFLCVAFVFFSMEVCIGSRQKDGITPPRGQAKLGFLRKLQAGQHLPMSCC